jgi:hypothetical protein
VTVTLNVTVTSETQKAATMARDKAYLEAEKKIEQALKSGATELELS